MQCGKDDMCPKEKIVGIERKEQREEEGKVE